MIRYWGGGGGVHMGLRWDNFLRHGACLVLSSPLDMGGFWRSPAPHPRQNLVQYPPRDTGPLTVKTKWRWRRCIGGDCVVFSHLLNEIRLQLSHKASQQVLLQYVSHTAETDKVSLALWSMVSQNLRPLGAARTMWVYFALCQQSTLKKSKLGVRLVLEVLAKLMVGENSCWEFPKVGVRLILEVHLILETRRYALKLCPSIHINSLPPGRCGSNFVKIILKLVILNSRLSTHCAIAFRWILQNFTNEKSTLV